MHYTAPISGFDCYESQQSRLLTRPIRAHPDLDPHIQALGHDLAERSHLDPHNKAASLFRAFNQLADELKQECTSIAATRADMLWRWQAEDQALGLPRGQFRCVL